MGKRLDKNFVENLKQFFKSQDTQYIVFDINILLEMIDQMQYIELERLIDSYDDYIEHQLQKKVDDYFVIPRNKLTSCLTQKDFEEKILKKEKNNQLRVGINSTGL
jgi:hypothetical protein